MDTFAVTEIPRLLLADLHCGTVIVIYVLLTTDVHLCYTIMAAAHSNSFCSISELLPMNWQILLGTQDNENVDGEFTVKTHTFLIEWYSSDCTTVASYPSTCLHQSLLFLSPAEWPRFRFLLYLNQTEIQFKTDASYFTSTFYITYFTFDIIK